ncbi:MAG: flagellar brake protein, partial [Burkholderiales bacterium]
DQPGGHRAERLRRSPQEIAHILGMLQFRNEPVTAHLQSGELLFESRLRAVDPAQSFIILESSSDEAANAALLSRPRCTFFASLPGGHVEFAAADPQQIVHDGAAAIRLRFPDVLVDRQRRGDERATISPQVPLVCLADAGGVLSFEGGLVDISVGGLGFLVYDPSITLEPGTVLKGCRIDPGAESPLILDLEVRYSELVSFADGTRAERSGCRVVEHAGSLKEFVAGLQSAATKEG